MKKSVMLGAAALAVAIAAFFLIPRGVAVEVVAASQSDLTQSVVVSGRVASPARSQISSQTTARIEDVLVLEGATVKAGQALVRLRDEEAKASLAQADAAVAEARAALQRLQTVQVPVTLQQVEQARALQSQAQQEWQRAQDLQAKGFVSESRVDDARRQALSAQAALLAATAQAAGNAQGGAELAAAQARLAQAQSAQAVARSRSEQQVLRAVAQGVVIQRAADPGDTAQPGKVLLVLAHGQGTRIDANVDEKYLRYLRTGQAATASADAYPDQRFAAHLNYLAPAVDPQRGTVEMRLAVDQPPSYLLPDMTVSVEVITGKAEAAITIPADALRRDAESSPYVLVMREGRAERRPVKTGLIATGAVQITQGLAVGDMVILSGSDVREGQRVREWVRRAPRANVPNMPGFTS